MTVERDLRVHTTNVVVDHYHPRGADLGVLVWVRTPYRRKGAAPIAVRFAKAGAHVLVEEVPGDDLRYAPDQAAGILAWLRTQSWFPGTIATWGLSAMGYASWAMAELEIPEWRLAILLDAQSELRDTIFYPGGAFAAPVALSYVHTVEWLARHPRASLVRRMLDWQLGGRGVKRVAAEQAPLGTADQRLVGHRVDYYQQLLGHEHDEDYWQRLDRRGNAKNMPEHVHLASGWYDVCLPSVLAGYRAVRDAGKQVRLVIGPWFHGRALLDQPYKAEVMTWLRAAGGGAAVPDQPSVRVHVGGADQWRDLPDWPPAHQPTSWHLHPQGRLASTPAPAGSFPESYHYDPANPTPAVGGAVENVSGAAGPKDNRRLERRSDVRSYTSDPLDADLELIGPVTATITLRATQPDVDVFVRLCHVDPKGRSTNICDGIRRLRPLDPPPNELGLRTVTVDLIGIAHLFRVGHRLRVQISSGAHPRFARNTGTGEPLATATTLRALDVEIHPPSRITLPMNNNDRRP